MEHLKQIKGNTWCLECMEMIPVYFLNDKDIVLLDSGFQNPDETAIRNMINDNGLNVKAVICSHNHIDHAGNNKMLQEEFHAEIIHNYVEDALGGSPTILSSLYRLVRPSEMAEHCAHLLVKADRVFTNKDESIKVGDAEFTLYPLPGHTVGHTAIKTPDNVLYLGDALVSDFMLEKSKLLTTMNWSEDYESKEKMRHMGADYYVLAHKEICQNVTGLIDRNIEKSNQIANAVIDTLKTNETWTASEIETAIWKAFGMRSHDFFKIAIFRRNLSTCLEYLVDSCRVSLEIVDGTGKYRVIK